MKRLTSLFSISFLSFSLLLISFNILAAPVKTTDEYWQDIGYSFDYVIENHVNNDKCLLDEEVFIACVNGLNSLTSMTYDKPHVLVPRESYEVYQSFGKEIKTVGRDYVIIKLKTVSDEDDVVAIIKEVNALKLKTLEIWKNHIEKVSLASVDIDKILEELEDLFVTNENQLKAALTLIDGFIVQKYYDHSRILPIDEMLDSAKQSDESFYGIGAMLSRVNKKTIITSTIEGGGAKEAGLRGGDEILAVDGTAILDMTLSKVVGMVKGPEGTMVMILINRKGNKLEFDIKRKKIVVKNVESRVIDHQDKKIGYIKLKSFMKDDGCSDIRAAISNFESKKVKGLILDLRGNGGGLVRQASCIGGAFLGKNKLFSEMKLVDWGVTTELVKTTSSKITDLPLVILINHSSASASEMLTGALHHYGRALSVGTRTFGKGSAQSITDARSTFGANLYMRNGSNGVAFAVTRQRFYGPDGNSNQLVGIPPHFTVPYKGLEIIEIREADIAFNPVPADGVLNKRKPPFAVKKCVEVTGIAEESYQKSAIENSFDFQLLYAQDVVSCMKMTTTDKFSILKKYLFDSSKQNINNIKEPEPAQ